MHCRAGGQFVGLIGDRLPIDMQVLCFHPKTLTSLMGNACEDGRDIVLVEPIEGSPRRVVIEDIRADARTQKVGHRLVLEELWHQREPPIGKAQFIEDHGDGDGSVTYHTLLCRGWQHPTMLPAPFLGRLLRQCPNDPSVHCGNPQLIPSFFNSFSF